MKPLKLDEEGKWPCSWYHVVKNFEMDDDFD